MFCVRPCIVHCAFTADIHITGIVEVPNEILAAYTACDYVGLIEIRIFNRVVFSVVVRHRVFAYN